MCFQLLALTLIYPTFTMTSLCVFCLLLVMHIIFEVNQLFGYFDGCINGLDFSPLQLCLGPISQFVHEVEHHVFVCAVGNLKGSGVELLHVRPNPTFLQFLNLYLIS